METTENKYADLTVKIMEGIRRAYEKLVRREAVRDGELVFSENGKIKYVKARELLKTLTPKP